MFKPNLIGFAVGNGVTNWEYDCNPAYVKMGYWHSLYSEDLHERFEKHNCDFGGLGMPKATAECKALYGEFMLLTRDVNIYNIYGICYGTSENPQLLQSSQTEGMTAKQYTPWLGTSDPADSLPPCTFGTPLMTYFDRPDIREALHIDSKVGAWTMCTDGIDYTSEPQASMFLYERLYGKMRMMHFSGDVDGAVPTIGTQGWIDSLNWEVEDEWRPWMHEGQVAGYVETFKNDFTFITVHGSGHMVPEDKPAQAHKMIYDWIKKVPL